MPIMIIISERVHYSPDTGGGIGFDGEQEAGDIDVVGEE